MANETPITIVGRLTADPELRYTQGGTPVANFTVATNARRYDKQTNEWRDEDASFLRCAVFREHAENIAASLVKGTRVVVLGNLKQQSWETREGEKRTGFQVDVLEVGPTLRYAKGTLERAGDSTPRAERRSTGAWADENNWDGRAPQGGRYDAEVPF